MSRNGTSVEQHHCMQAQRLLHIEAEIAEMEARRREDVRKTRDVLRGMVGQLNTALEFFTTAQKQIKMLYARVGELTKELGRQVRRGPRLARRNNLKAH